MKLLQLLTLVSWAAAVPTARSAVKGISESLYNRLVHFNAISQATYAGDLCVLPGLTRVASILNTTTDIHGWILRDDVAQELIVAFRGTLSLTNLNTDENYTLANFDTLPSCSGCQVHGGYYLAWLSVLDQVQSLVDSQMTALPSYNLIITGHRSVKRPLSIRELADIIIQSRRIPSNPNRSPALNRLLQPNSLHLR